MFVAERIGALALEEDLAGVAMWKDFASALDRVLRLAGSA